MMQTVILSRNTFVKWTALENYLNVIIKVVGLSMQSMVLLRVIGIIRLVGLEFFFDNYLRQTIPNLKTARIITLVRGGTGLSAKGR